MGVDLILSVFELFDFFVDYLSVMIYLNWFWYVILVKLDNEKLSIQGDFDNYLIGVQVLIQILFQVDGC